MDQRELRMNIVAIKRVDPYAKDIIDSSAHVAFYTFNKEEEEWEKTDVEGAFFIYSRNAEPYHSVFINNRLNTKSLVEPITAQIELQIEAPFMLYRNERSRTRCFWFYNKAECERIGALVERIIQSSDKNSNYKDISFLQHSQQMNKNVDIFSMLTKAQEDFNNSVAGIPAAGMSTTALPNKFPEKSPANPDVTSQSVMNFFAAAKPAAPKEVPFFQRMLSQPVHVDQIEKQQRTVTPHDKNNSPPQESSINVANPATGGVENGATFMRIHSPNHPPEFGTSPFANFLTTSNRPAAPATANTTDVSELELRQKPLQALLKKTGEPVTGQSKPALMLPTMFAVTQSTTEKGGKSGAEPLSSTLGQLEQGSVVVPGKPEPLTQSQLLQAMSYLIKNDTDFVKKLHEAYLKSFTEMVSL